MPMVDIGDAELYAETHGAGPPLMLVTGLGGQGAFWGNQLAPLAEHFTVTIHDHRGTGQSSKSEIEYSVQQMADDAVRLMDALKIERAHYIGHSTGGAMGQLIAAQHPDRVATLVLSATWPKSDTYFKRAFGVRKKILEQAGVQTFIEEYATFLYPEWFVNERWDELLEMEKKQVASFPPPHIFAARIQAICDFEGTDLSGLKMPSLIVCAKDDKVTPFYNSEALAGMLPHARLVALETGGHFAPITVPDAYNAAVLDFLKEHANA